MLAENIYNSAGNCQCLIVKEYPSQAVPYFCWLFLGLQPYTNYSFTLAAFTSAGCTSSEPSVGQTLQAAPQGNQDGSVVQRKRLYVLFQLTV